MHLALEKVLHGLWLALCCFFSCNCFGDTEMTETAAPQAYIYISRSAAAPRRWVVQVIQGSTVYTPDDNLRWSDVKATVKEYRAMFPGAIISQDV
jgi:hypothetical protein